jgi:lysophospholipase L1-like esterase
MTNKPLVAYGDSITTGVGASVPANAYLQKLKTALAVTASMVATTGDMAADQSWRIYGMAADPTKDTTIMLGANDAQIYGASAVKREAAINFLRNVVVWSMCQTKVNARSMTATGSWSNTPVNSIGRVSAVAGSTLEATVSGTAVYVSYILQNLGASEGQFDVLIDGVVMKTVTLNGTQVGNTQNGRSYSGACIRIGGLAPGSHTVKIVTKNGNSCHIDYVAGSDQPSDPRVFVADVLKRSIASYGASGNSDANVAAYNADYATMIADLASDGHSVLPVHFPDITLADLNDGLHPNDSGHAKIAVDFQSAILGTVVPPAYTYTLMNVYQRNDGVYVIGDGPEPRPQVQTV